AQSPHTGSSSQCRPEGRACAQGALHPVLVKAPAPVGAAVVGAGVQARDARVLCLGGDARGRVHGVGVVDRADHLLGVDGLAAIERDAEVAVGAQALELIHVVGDS